VRLGKSFRNRWWCLGNPARFLLMILFVVALCFVGTWFFYLGAFNSKEEIRGNEGGGDVELVVREVSSEPRSFEEILSDLKTTRVGDLETLFYSKKILRVRRYITLLKLSLKLSSLFLCFLVAFDISYCAVLQRTRVV
jgi:hypothetical protein